MGSFDVLDTVTSSARFVREFARAPQRTGAILPSSPFLAQKVVEWVDWSSTLSLLEWGPGTGAFTEFILRYKRTDCQYLGFEVNPALCNMLRRRFPQARFCHESVANAGYVCANECLEEVDCVISGLPWAVFPEDRQREFMEAMMTVLRRGGQFTTFAYLHGLSLPAGRRFRQLLRSYFSELSWSEVVWLNVPPALVYRCRR